jgi:protein-tyrosine phosphatase
VQTPDKRRPFRVLAVCTGNICRSPAVERLLAAGLSAPYAGSVAALGDGEPPELIVASAGVGALVGSGMAPMMASLVRATGADADGFSARQLTAETLRDADLVLALTRRHRSAIVELFPGAVRRTFTLRELARLTVRVDPALLPSAPGTTAADRLRALVPLAAAQRGHVHAAHGDDVVDPYRGDGALYRRSFDELRPAVDTLVHAALGTTGTTSRA